MKKNNFTRCIIGLCSVFCTLYSFADDELNRSVTVERDFQPVIQDAGKVATTPEVVETTIEPAEVEYSDYTANVTPDVQYNSLLSQPTRFVGGKTYHGYVRGAIGHPNTLFDLGYNLNNEKHSILDLYAHHRAEWGLRTLSKTKVGLNYTYTFSRCNLYFGANGGNIYYHKYGHFYDYSLANPGAWIADKTAYPTRNFADPAHKTNLWTAEAFIGVRSNAKEDVQYMIQTGYALFAKPGAVAEHQVRSRAAFDWHRNAHHVGANLFVQNTFLQLGSLGAVIAPQYYEPRHAIRLEPYYAYNTERVRLHAGVNLDMNIGLGQNSLSATPNLSFAPSPHIHLDALLAQWITLYADAKGNHGLGTVQAFMESNRYRVIHDAIESHHVAGYTPVDAELGFLIRPHRDLLLELHGGFAVLLNNTTLIATADSARFHNVFQVPMQAGDFSYTFTDLTRGKVGAKMDYHYQDVLHFHLYGDYYFWQVLRYEANNYAYTNPAQVLTDVLNDANHTVYDRAAWELGLRVDGRIDQHWSLYSDNHFAGSRLALATDGEHRLKPTIQLNLGVQYETFVGKKARAEKLKPNKDGSLPMRPQPQPNLAVFLQLNNWLHYKNDIYYGYNSEGINFLLGVTFRF